MIVALLLGIVGWQDPKLQGAEWVLNAVRTQPKAAAALTPGRKLVAEAHEYESRSKGMSVDAAAAGYVQLLDDWRANRYSIEDGLTKSEDMFAEALPRPEVWPAIKLRIQKLPVDKKNRVLIMFFDLLLGNDAQVLDECEGLRKPNEDANSDMAGSEIDKIELPIALRTRNAELVRKILTRQARSFSGFFMDGVPDFVSALGVEAARPIAKSLLEAASQSISTFHGTETRALMRSVMFEDLANIKIPQWDLATSVEDAAKMVARYGTENLQYVGDSEEFSLRYLLTVGNFDGAAKLRFDLSDQAFFEPLGKLLDKHPESELWAAYTDMARKMGRLSEVEGRLQSLLGRAGTIDLRRHLLGVESKLEAGSGHIDRAFELLLQSSKLRASDVAYDSYEDDLINMAIAIGTDKAIDAAIKAAKPTDAAGYDLLYCLVDRGRLAEAQRDLIAVATSTTLRRQNVELKDIPAQLAELYYRANSPQDIVELLNRYPAWHTDDLLHIVTLGAAATYSRDHGSLPLGFCAALAFSLTGKRGLAIRTLHELLQFDPGLDSSYELLNKLEGKNALAFYDQLSALDPFAARPVAWRADLLLRLGRVAEAERFARKAVAMDPTDGNAPRGSRLSSYSILARVLRAAGKAQEAESYEKIVRAVRIAEKGDAFRDLNLMPQAIAQYREADQVFADAYCIHFRLAASLAESGDEPAAVSEYRRAYDLMPASFGEASELCFGCESGLADSDRRKTALPVLERLVKSAPNNPRNWYILGQVRAESGDSAEALRDYAEATRLDPRYLNAWNAIVEVGDLSPKNRPLRQKAWATMMRLDPMELHGGYRATRYIDDYKELWRIFAARFETLPAAPQAPLFPLSKVKDPYNPMSLVTYVDDQRGPGGAPLRQSPGAQFNNIAQIQSVKALYVFVE